METLNPNLLLIQDLKLQLYSGKSVKESILLLHRRYKTDLSYQLNRLILNPDSFMKLKNHHMIHRSLLILVEGGLRGQSITEELESLEEEYLIFCEIEMESYFSKLPMYSLIPLLLLQFTSLMGVLVLPIVWLSGT